MGGPVRENYIYRFVFQYCKSKHRYTPSPTTRIQMEWEEGRRGGGEGGGRKKRKGSRSCILQPRTNGIPDLRSRILLDKPDPYRTSAICHTAPEQTSFRSSINHLFLFFFFSSSSVDRCCCSRLELACTRAYVYSDRAHASIIFPAAKLAHPHRRRSSRRRRRLTQ